MHRGKRDSVLREEVGAVVHLFPPLTVCTANLEPSVKSRHGFLNSLALMGLSTAERVDSFPCLPASQTHCFNPGPAGWSHGDERDQLSSHFNLSTTKTHRQTGSDRTHY